MASARKTLWVASVAALILTLGAADALAQYYGGPHHYHGPRWGYRHRTHAYFGGQLMGFIVAAQISDYTDGYLGHGGGGGLFGGIRLNPFVSLEGNWMMTFHDETFQTSRGETVVDLDSIYLMTFTLDAKFHIPTRGPIEPYFQAGVGFAYAGVTYPEGVNGDSVFAEGPVFNLGGGLDFWLGPWFSLGGRLLYRGIYFAEPNANGIAEYSNYINGLSVDVNATIHF